MRSDALQSNEVATDLSAGPGVSAPVAPVEAEKLVGQPLPRLEDARYLTGRALYLDDLDLPHLADAAFVRSPFAHAGIQGFDLSPALEIDGVLAVLTGDDLRAACSGPMVITKEANRAEVRTSHQTVLPTDKVRFVGEAVAVVVAESRYLAEDAAEQVVVDWEPLDAVPGSAQALAEGAPILHDDIPDNRYAHMEHEHGDLAAALAGASRVFRKHFTVGRWMANPLEPRGVVARFDSLINRGELWSSCQLPMQLRGYLARIIGVHESRLRVHAPDVGGSFGLKGGYFVEDPALLVAAKIVGRPVKWIEDRAEHLTASSHAKQMRVDLEIGVDDQGRFTGFGGRYEGDAGAYAQQPGTPLQDVLQAAALLPSLYDVPALRYELDSAFTNKCPACAARAVGWSSGQMPRELLIDEIARDLEIDPVDLRLRNCLGPEPTTSATGLSYDGGSYAESIEHVAELMDYRGLRERQADLRRSGRYLGIGISPFIEPGAYATIHARALGTLDPTFDTASVTIESDGSVTVRTPFHSQGQGHETTFAQFTSDLFSIPIDRVNIVQGDSDSPYGFGTFGSRAAVIGTELIRRAATDLLDKLTSIAAHILGCAPAEVRRTAGAFRSPGPPEGALSLQELAEAVHFGGPENIPAALDPSLSATRHYDPPETYTNGVIASTVEVDVETGQVDVGRLWAVEDGGVILNPLVVEGQIAGGSAQGLGMAMLEELVYDEDAQPLSSSLMDYLYPSAMEVPEMSLAMLKTIPAGIPAGVKGLGQGGAIAAPAAILQAIADALSPWNVRLTTSPVRPDEIRVLLRASEADPSRAAS